MAVPPNTYSVLAYNTAGASENKIHDDAVAQRFGFAGGLVPGVEVYAYMTHMPVERWGRAWLARGTAECRFRNPVYDGETAIVSARDTPSGLDIDVESRGVVCAIGKAGLPPAATAPSLGSFARVPECATRPAADETSLAPGTWLGVEPFVVTAEMAAQYLRDVRESAAIYDREDLLHPGIVLRLGNFALMRNVVLGPWIHVGSEVQHLAAARVGNALDARARVVANYEHKGHRFVALEVLVVADEVTPVALVNHLAIYRPRQTDAV